MASKRAKRTAEEIAAWERKRKELEELFERRRVRLDAAEAREAERRAKLRRWTFGVLGREPVTPS